jgi:hypothetical protein
LNELLNLALRAHGGLDRWNMVKSVKMQASITGAIWYLKGKPDYLKNIVMTADAKTERVVTNFPGHDKRSIFEPNRIVMEKLDGTVMEARDNPEKSFEGHERDTPWDDIHVAFFSSEALWTYLTTPFLYTYEGFKTEEIASIRVEKKPGGA